VPEFAAWTPISTLTPNPTHGPMPAPTASPARQPKIGVDRVSFYYGPRRVLAESGVQLLDFGERDYLIKLSLDLFSRHPQDSAVQKNILSSCQLGMKARAYLEQARNSSADSNATRGRLGDAREDLQQSRFACAVSPDDADDFAARYFEIDVLQCPERLGLPIADCRLPIAEPTKGDCV